MWTFLRLAAELHSVDAPPALIAAAIDAADDEVRHAGMCARAAGGIALAPLSMLAAQPRFTRRSPDALALLAHEAWIEGCLNEGTAAEEARLAATDAQDDTRGTLATIARDEATHAALAWEVLAWVQSVAPVIAQAAVSAVPARKRFHRAPFDRALTRRGVASTEARAAAYATATTAARARARDLVG